jgi:hypothetical protein
MRIRTDGKFARRETALDAISSFYGCNKTQAVMYAVEDARATQTALTEFLDRDDVPAKAKRAAVETFDRQLSWTIEYDEKYTVTPSE